MNRHKYGQSNFSYGVQVLSNALKGGKIGFGAGVSGGILGKATNKLSTKQSLATVAGASLLGTGIGALKGALEEHSRHKKLRKAGIEVNKDGIATIKDKNGLEYKVSVQPHGKRTKGGMYINDPNLPTHSKSLLNRLRYDKLTGIDLPRGVKDKDLLLLEPKELHYDPETMKGVALHEVGHLKNSNLAKTHQKNTKEMQQKEEAEADRYSIEHGGNAKAMIRQLEESYHNAFKHHPKYKKLDPEKQKRIVREAIMKYRGNYLYKQADKESHHSYVSGPIKVYSYVNFGFLPEDWLNVFNGNKRAIMARQALIAALSGPIMAGAGVTGKAMNNVVSFFKTPTAIERTATVDRSNEAVPEDTSQQNISEAGPQLSLNNLPPEIKSRIVKDKITKPTISKHTT
jgi:hypothetical protein